MINAQFPYEKKFLPILGSNMAYVEVGSGDPIVFLHGNATSSYLWRNVIPHVEGLGRCIAPDLIGMGDSDKLPNSGPGSYTFVEHRRYLDALLAALGANERVTLIGHDWGSTLSFDWANRHRDSVKGIAYMEPIVKERAWSEWPENIREGFRALRSADGERIILEQNFFIETVLPNSTLRPLTEEEMEHYRRPFAEPGEGRRPMLAWPRQLPVEGDPPDMVEIVSAYAAWLQESPVPKLYVNNDPGTAHPSTRQFCLSFPAQTAVTVNGRHYLQEDSPDEIGQAIASWLKQLG